MTVTRRLLALQVVDTSMDRLGARRKLLESGEALSAARTSADAADAVFGELRLRIDEMNRDASRFEHEIDTIGQKQAAEEKRLYDGSVVNVKEMEALQHEIENLKKRRSDREDELLALMEQREALESQAVDAKVVGDAEREKVDEVGSSGRDELASIQAELSRFEEERAKILPDIPSELLELYEELRPQKKGVAAAALTDGVCQGCHEQLSSVELDKLKKTDGVPRCEYCRRILIL
jgi:predicted  nucleic acid-binding Zn-ribbon protein